MKETSLTTKQLRAAFDLTSDVMAISRLKDGQFIEVNAAFTKLMGVKSDQVYGKTSLELGLWHDEQRREIFWELMRSKGGVVRFNAFMKDSNGKQIETRINASTVEVDNEPCIVVILRDVTKTNQTKRALKAVQDRLFRMFEQSPLPMAYVHPYDTSTTQYNSAWFKAFGFDEVLDQGKSGIELQTWVNQSERQETIDRALLGQDTVGREVQMRHADGEVRWINLHVRVAIELEQKVFIFSYQDVTNEKKMLSELEQKVEQRTSELERKNRELTAALANNRNIRLDLAHAERRASLGSLVAGVAHELNTPIGNAITLSTILEGKLERFQHTVRLDSGEENARLVKCLQESLVVMTRNLNRAGHLLSSFSKVAVDQISSQRRSFSLGSVIRELTIIVQQSLLESGCELESDFGKGVLMDSYPAPLGQVLEIIVRNAILHAYSKTSSNRVITIKTGFLGATHAVIEVIDLGRGIHPDHLSRIFDPFFTTRFGQGSSGLGLHIAHNIVTLLLGGTIQVTSKGKGQGTTVRMELPLSALVETPCLVVQQQGAETSNWGQL